MRRLPFDRLLAFLAFLAVGFTAAKSEPSPMTDNTKVIFGDDVKLLPVAFGDFNMDKSTDIFALNEDKNELFVIFADSATFSRKNSYFLREKNRPDRVRCSMNIEIHAVIPADFDGDGGMDVFVTAKFEEDRGSENLTGFVIYGKHDGNGHKLLCPDTNPKYSHHIKMSVQPISLDANGDATSDIFGAQIKDDEVKRGIWIYPRGIRTEPPEFHEINDAPIFSRHSNSFVDVDGDGNADLIVVGQNKIEIWLKVSNSHPFFHHERNFSIQSCAGENFNPCLVGQMAITDIDANADLDLLLPVCYDESCNNSTLFQASFKDMMAKENPLKPSYVTKGSWNFGFNKEFGEPYQSMAVRVGDINLDGYPDLLIRMKQVNLPNDFYQTHLFMNVEFDSDSILPKPPKGTRGFVLEESFLVNVKNTLAAAFFDLYEDGSEDIIFVRQEGKELVVGSLANHTSNGDSYFVKIIVLTSACSDECSYKDHRPFGTNSQGHQVCYEIDRPTATNDFFKIHTCSSQMTQTAFTSLQLPYKIFGLGRIPNYVKTMTIKVTNSSVRSDYRKRSWSQIIPNSQLYVVPYRGDHPDEWQLMLFLTPGQTLTFTAIALLGLCFLTGMVILFLHWREKVQDRREKLQQANRFHFDAM